MEQNNTPTVLKEYTNSPAEMIREALMSQQGIDLDKLGKLLEIQERYEANQARKEYHRAMTAFKADPPIIVKDKHVSFSSSKGTVKYNHATLANVTQSINQSLSKHGLSASWRVQQNGVISVTCKITHEKGHSEETTMTAPADSSGTKNDIQAIGSTIAYLERYTILALCGLATQEMDDDANKAKSEPISEDEKNAILDNLLSLGADVDKFLQYMGIEKLEDMQKSDLKKAYVAIEEKKKLKK